MNDADQRYQRVRAIILNACRGLEEARTSRFTFRQNSPVDAWDSDYGVLLRDATEMYCRTVSEVQGEPEAHRWSPELPALLLQHPERCDETLAQFERKRLGATTE